MSQTMDSTSFIALALRCAPQIDAGTAHALVAVESGFNPHAIGVLGGSLERQPRTHAQALATAGQLERDRWNFSVGLAQINRSNFERLGLDIGTALEPCNNLRAMQTVLGACFDAAGTTARTTAGTTANTNDTSRQSTLRRALSCYYSGNFRTGFEHGYVSRVVNAARTAPRQAGPL